MNEKLKTIILWVLAVNILILLMQRSNISALDKTSTDITIFGLVNNPLSLTQAELLSLPMVSEIATLKCVFGTPTVTFNWTGIPLFHLLTLAQAKPEALEVVFRAPDGFSSSLLIEDVLKPYVILALKANGTLLSEIEWIADDVQGGFRIVVPCKYGYKWVANVREIEVVDYDYKGTYESTFGYSEEDANIPDCTPPSITPPLQTFNSSFGARNFQVEIFTNVSINAFNFDYLQKEIILNVASPVKTSGFMNVILQQSLLKGPYTVFLNENTIGFVAANLTNLSFLYMVFPEGSHTIKIAGTEFFGAIPKIIAKFSPAFFVDESVTFDASQSVDDGQIVSFVWDFGDGAKGSGPVVYHSYSEEGLYQILLNVTDNDGLSNSKLLTVTVQKQSQIIPLFLRVFLVATLCLLVLIFVTLLLKRDQNPETTRVFFSYFLFLTSISLDSS